ncbi:hypothetical protein BKA62DRAFT_773096 [Auriculariales sp. MPI-PUGE-AT-0066]|nr:hypothetical protein BKA62DRAFT_773096 [Auriculariales sp. MPI-PUGE-AT-0066]
MAAANTGTPAAPPAAAATTTTTTATTTATTTTSAATPATASSEPKAGKGLIPSALTRFHSTAGKAAEDAEDQLSRG